MKITPRINKSRKTMDYADLNNGDTFMYGGELCVKCNFGNQEAACLSSADEHFDELCGTQVIPVNAEIKWSYKKTTKK